MKLGSRYSFSVIFFLTVLAGCQKFLDEKTNSKLIVPEELRDLQALLDEYSLVNQSGIGAMEACSDDYYLSESDFQGLNTNLQHLYIWGDLAFPAGTNDWSRTYDNVYIANTVLDHLSEIARTEENKAEWDNIKGQALFLRAKCFLQALLTWSVAYDASTAENDWGIPLRLTSDMTVPTQRASVAESYNQIIADLEEAIDLLENDALHVLRASKAAAFSMLARTYLSMRDYDKCFEYSNKALAIKNDLLDYNLNPPLNPGANFPFNNISLLYNNPEIIYASRMSTPSLLGNTRAKIDSTLYDSYEANDLRRVVFLKPNSGASAGTFGFKGSYDGSANLFDGLATDEVFLMRAECYARKDMILEAMNDLNTLMIKRWKDDGSWVPFDATNPDEALEKVLNERRKELLMRGLRWMDIKRLNKEGRGITIERKLGGNTYKLVPNDPKYALPIPGDVISLAGIPQNSR
jgi:SusD family.